MIQGNASILQHPFAPEQLSTLMQGANKKSRCSRLFQRLDETLALSTRKSHRRLFGRGCETFYNRGFT